MIVRAPSAARLSRAKNRHMNGGGWPWGHVETKSNYFAQTGIWGLFLVIIGAWWGLSELGLVPFRWSAIGPLALVIVGAGMLFGMSGWCRKKEE